MQKLDKGEYLGNIKSNFFTPGISIIETIYKNEVFEGWHFHENPYLSFILEGGNRETRKTNTFDSTPGKIIFYRQGEWHRNTNTVISTRTINIEIEPAWLLENSLVETNLSGCTENPSTKFNLLKMYSEGLLADNHAATSIQMLMLQISNQQHNASTKKPLWIKTIHSLLNDEWDRTFSLAELSEKTGVSPVNISKYFPKYFYCTLGEYMRKLKVAHSLSMIKTDNYSLTGVALDCGFADQSHFIRSFKTATGLLPGQYKRL